MCFVVLPCVRYVGGLVWQWYGMEEEVVVVMVVVWYFVYFANRGKSKPDGDRASTRLTIIGWRGKIHPRSFPFFHRFWSRCWLMSQCGLQHTSSLSEVAHKEDIWGRVGRRGEVGSLPLGRLDHGLHVGFQRKYVFHWKRFPVCQNVGEGWGDVH